MKFLILILLGYIPLTAEESLKYEISSSIRFLLARDNSSSPIVYYFNKPIIACKSYPILVVCEGSCSRKDPGSVLFIRNYLAERVQTFPVGYLAVEKWGIDGNEVDEEEFWNHYTRSQRLEDHLKVIHHLEQNPPEGWNGKLIFLGASEGGPLVTDLSIIYPNTLATINWVGAEDSSWANELWQFFEHLKQNSFWMRLYDAIPRWLPYSSDLPTTREEYDLLIQHIIQNPTPHKSMGGMSYLYHADAFKKTPIDYSKIYAPFLVVAGSEDSTVEFCDRFVLKAKEADAPITYFRIEGMDHWIRKRPDVIDQSFEWLKEQLKQCCD